jgi:hypothetical protein
MHPPIEDNPPVRRPHSISRAKFVAVLGALQSPAADEAAALAAIPERYGIDRGIALAFFVHESGAGRLGICRDYGTRNWGNLRKLQQAHRGIIVPTRGGAFASYLSWAAGLEDWCELLIHTYEGRWGLVSLGEILRKYAPKADKNDPAAYAAKVVRHIRRWQAEEGKAGAPARRSGAWPVVVTAANGLNIRQGRGTDFPSAGKLSHGDRVLVDDDTAGWLHLADGRGFVAKPWTRPA